MSNDQAEMATYISPSPEWLPTDMRYTATPVERLRSLLRYIAGGEPLEYALLRARATKVQHLCRQINEQACAAPVRRPANLREAREVIGLALAFLDEPRIAASPPIGLIYSIYACAVALSAAGKSSAAKPGGARRTAAAVIPAAILR